MKVLVTGATGFIGRHVIRDLLGRNHSITAVARNPQRMEELGWPDEVNFVSCDIHAKDLNETVKLGDFDYLMHVAWPGLPDYKSLFHLEKVLPAECQFLKSAIKAGCRNILVTGTCFEYGMQNGCLHEGMETRPVNPYALAKDTLRRYLEALSESDSFNLKWARLFYMYGAGQNQRSLFSQLDSALERGDKEFPMSGGEQLRDYLPVERVASSLVDLLENTSAKGVFNICSGQPVSVRRLVEEHLLKRGKKISLKLGHYPYPDYEPFAFWGSNKKFRGLNIE